MTNFKVIVRADRTVSTCSSLSPPIKALVAWLSGVGAGVGPLDRCLLSSLSPPGMLASNIKLTFPPTYFFLGFIGETWDLHFQLYYDPFIRDVVNSIYTDKKTKA